MAIEAIKRDRNLSIRAAAKTYDVPYTTLQNRLRGRCARQDTRPNSLKLDVLEEKCILQYILDLDTRGFPPKLADVEEMANVLLAERDAGRVGKRWASKFVKRQPSLRTRFNRACEYRRALCEDTEKIKECFALVEEIRIDNGIVDADVFHFDETGFAVGVITPSMVATRADRKGRAKTVHPDNREWVTVIQGVSAEGWCVPPMIVDKGTHHLTSWYTDASIPPDWVIKPTSDGWTDNETGLDWIRHFDKYTSGRRVGRYRLLLIDGHASHVSVEFNRFCKAKDIITVSMPPHSSHLLQLLDVGCSSPLKRAYSGEIEKMVKTNVSRITKMDFFAAFQQAFKATFTTENVKAGFRGGGIVPLDPDAVLSKLDVRLRTPSPPPTLPTMADIWSPRTPQNAADFRFQAEYIKSRFVNHLDSSPTSFFEAVEQIARSGQTSMHSNELNKINTSALQRANATLFKRQAATKSRQRLGGSLTAQEGMDLVTQKALDNQIQQETQSRSGRQRRAEPDGRRCSKCGERGHNARTCQKQV